MKGLYRYLSPFTPDQSGAVSVLYELGGLIVICDAGGCSGNICGYDEPRWQTKPSAIFSAGLRDMDAIMGRDDRLIEKIGKALKTVTPSFIAVIGTPVPAVIGTDFKALRRLTENKFGLSVITVDTTGMVNYDRGQEKAYMALLDVFCGEHEKPAGTACSGIPFAGVWGATPLDLAAPDSAGLLRNRLAQCCGEAGGIRIVTYGMDSTLDDVRMAGQAVKNYVVSPSGLKPAEYLKKTFGTPYEVVSPLGPVMADKKIYIPGSPLAGPVLIMHQQFMADGIRTLLRKSGRTASDTRIDTASFFLFDKAYAESGDTALTEEDGFISLVRERGYKTVIADPMFFRALPDFTGTRMALPHFAVSGQICALSSEADFLAMAEVQV